MNSNDMFSQTEYDNLGAVLVRRIKASHNNNKFYYILQYKSDNRLSIISWDDEALLLVPSHLPSDELGLILI